MTDSNKDESADERIKDIFDGEEGFFVASLLRMTTFFSGRALRKFREGWGTGLRPAGYGAAGPPPPFGLRRGKPGAAKAKTPARRQRHENKQIPHPHSSRFFG